MSGVMQNLQFNGTTIAVGLFSLGAVALFIANIAMLAQNGIMADSYSDLKGQLSTIWSLGGVGILLSFIAIWIYCNQKSESTPIFIVLIMSSLAIFISYCAMASAVIVKK